MTADRGAEMRPPGAVERPCFYIVAGRGWRSSRFRVGNRVADQWQIFTRAFHYGILVQDVLNRPRLAAVN